MKEDKKTIISNLLDKAKDIILTEEDKKLKHAWPKYNIWENVHFIQPDTWGFIIGKWVIEKIWGSMFWVEGKILKYKYYIKHNKQRIDSYIKDMYEKWIWETHVGELKHILQKQEEIIDEKIETMKQYKGKVETFEYIQ